MHGYSDRINHALAFAAKHLDQQVRKGTRLPYLTTPANVGMILCRYGREEETVVAGILRDVVDDCVRDGFTAEMLTQRIGDKFGEHVLDIVLAACARRIDDNGVELSAEERRDDFLARMDGAREEARWVVAADMVHTGSDLLSNLARTDFPETIWGRFAAGREGTIRWYRRIHERLASVGFTGTILTELGEVVSALDQWMPEEETARN